MSELDLEMNHNYLKDVDLCKEMGLLYMDDGQLMKNGVVQDVDKL